jgi:KaiC/GvpD/RAD55 family RecA-like ATPase
MTAEEQRFVWRDRVPVGEITSILGAPARGKSTLSYAIAKEAGQSTLLITSEESDRSVWVPRLRAVGVDLGKCFTTTKCSSQSTPVTSTT